MKKYYNNFNFIGELGLPREKFYDVQTSKSGWTGHRLKFFLKEGKTNMAFLEMYGGFFNNKGNKVYSFSRGVGDEQGEKITFDWDERLNPNTIDMVADFSKKVIILEEDEEVISDFYSTRRTMRELEVQGLGDADNKARYDMLKGVLEEKSTNIHEFVTEYDAVVFLANTLNNYKGRKFSVNGSIELQEYKGKIYKKFAPQRIQLLPEDTDKESNLSANMTIFFQDGCLDDTDIDEDKKIYIDGYLMSYDREKKDDSLYPQQFVIDCSKIDFDNSQHQAILKVLKKQFETDNSNLHRLRWLVKEVNGSEEEAIELEDLSEAQRELVEAGLDTLESIQARTKGYGTRVSETRLVKPLLTGDFEDGAEDTLLDEDDVFDMMVQLSSDKSIDDLDNLDDSSDEVEEDTSESEKASKEDVSALMGDLFGN